MNISNSVKQQIWNTVLDGYEVNYATDAVKELTKAYCDLYEDEDKDNDACKLVKIFHDLDDVVEEAVKLALNKKSVCITAKDMQIRGIGMRLLQYYDYKTNDECIHHSFSGKTNIVYFKNGGVINLLPFSENNFVEVEFHNALIYMEGIDINIGFCNPYKKLVSICRRK